MKKKTVVLTKKAPAKKKTIVMTKKKAIIKAAPKKKTMTITKKTFFKGKARGAKLA